MSFTTYVVRCADDSFYTGWTTDIDERIRKHNEGTGARYTRGRAPVVLERAWQFDTKQDAMRLEWHLKQLPRAKKLAVLAGEIKVSDLLVPKATAGKARRT